MTTGTTAKGSGRIQRLSENVVNQIAAGEVIHRPSSALKELLENAVDAGATNINVTVTDGGLKLLQVRDNGRGIAKDDLAVLCHRHTTSKLSDYEDLAGIETLGFRGEALCSVSFVSRLSVVTMQADNEVGWKASYRDSELLSPGAQPCAAVPGTCMTVEDLFYNTPNRRRTMGSGAEEFKRIVDVVSRYAVYCSGVGITLKRSNNVKADVLTLPSHSRRDAIAAVYGSAIASNLLDIQAAANWPPVLEASASPQHATATDDASFSVDGYVSSPNVACKRTTLILFVNGRSVQCNMLKNVLDGVYAALHAKSSSYFAFFDVRMPSSHVDVNIHPTKSEVAMLHQEELVAAVRTAVSDTLAAGQNMRDLQANVRPRSLPVLPGQSQIGGSGDASAFDDSTDVRTQRAKAGGDHKLVRTDHRDRSLLMFMDAGNKPAAEAQNAALAGSVRRKGALKRRAVEMMDDQAMAITGPEADVRADPNPARSQDATVQALIDRVENRGHTAMTRAIREHKLVGHLDSDHVLLQHGTLLYMVNVSTLSTDLFYQQALRRCHAATPLELSDRPPLADLVRLGLESRQRSGTLTEEDGSVEELEAMILELLSLKAPLLNDAFRISMSKDRALTSLPVLIAGYAPDVNNLPEFLVELAVEIDWQSDSCYDSIAKALAELYRVGGERFADNSRLQESTTAAALAPSVHQRITEHIILPAMRHHLRVPFERATDGTFLQLASLEQLYKVFERC